MVNIRKELRERLTDNTSPKCEDLVVPDYVADYVKRFDSSTELLKSGGIPIDILDKWAFGFSSDEIKTIDPKRLSVKWKLDYDNVKHEVEHYHKKHPNQSLATNTKNWSKSINLSEPIEVSYQKGKFYIEDGHHRYFAAKTLGKMLSVDLEIKDNPILKIYGSNGYDDLHHCVFTIVSG
jgi:hypothetical protein